MSSGYRFLEVLFSTNCSDKKGYLEKLRNSLNEVSGATLVTGYDNGAKFLLHISQAENVTRAITESGFGIIQTGKFTDGTLLMVISGTAPSYRDMDHSKLTKLWE